MPCIWPEMQTMQQSKPLGQNVLWTELTVLQLYNGLKNVFVSEHSFKMTGAKAQKIKYNN